MRRLLLTLISLACVAAQSPPSGAWLESLETWNVAGAAVPTAPEPFGINNDRCGGDERWPESAEEEQVVAAGWRLFGAAQVGWGVRVVQALVDYDGMCRPMQFQVFVFADGAFAGTISPTPMDSRTDGTGHIVGLFGRDFLSGQFQRYTPTDPLCCPSSTFAVKYSIGDDQVLVPVSATRIRSP